MHAVSRGKSIVRVSRLRNVCTSLAHSAVGPFLVDNALGQMRNRFGDCDINFDGGSLIGVTAAPKLRTARSVPCPARAKSARSVNEPIIH